MDIYVIVLCVLTFRKHELQSYPVRRTGIFANCYDAGQFIFSKLLSDQIV